MRDTGAARRASRGCRRGWVRGWGAPTSWAQQATPRGALLTACTADALRCSIAPHVIHAVRRLRRRAASFGRDQPPPQSRFSHERVSGAVRRGRETGPHPSGRCRRLVRCVCARRHAGQVAGGAAEWESCALLLLSKPASSACRHPLTPHSTRVQALLRLRCASSSCCPARRCVSSLGLHFPRPATPLSVLP